MSVEILFNDLTEEKQKEILELYKIASPSEANLEIVPLAVIDEPEDEEEE